MAGAPDPTLRVCSFCRVCGELFAAQEDAVAHVEQQHGDRIRAAIAEANRNHEFREALDVDVVSYVDDGYPNPGYHG